MKFPAVQFSPCLYHFISHRSRFSLETCFQVSFFCILFKRDNFLIQVKQKPWSFMYLNAIICDTKHKDKIYTTQRQIKECRNLKKLSVLIRGLEL